MWSFCSNAFFLLSNLRVCLFCIDHKRQVAPPPTNELFGKETWGQGRYHWYPWRCSLSQPMASRGGRSSPKRKNWLLVQSLGQKYLPPISQKCNFECCGWILSIIMQLYSQWNIIYFFNGCWGVGGKWGFWFLSTLGGGGGLAQYSATLKLPVTPWGDW